MTPPDIFPEELQDACDAAKYALERGLDSLLGSFGRAQELGLDAGAILAAHLRVAMGEEGWAQMPPIVRMMFGS